MEQLFLHILNNAITVSGLIIAVIVVRVLGKKMPKWIHCLLWIIVAVKLVVPVQMKSILSLIPSGEPIPFNIALEKNPQINSGIRSIDGIVNPVIQKNLTPNPIASVNPLQVWLYIGGIVWLTGMTCMLFYAVITYLLMKRRVRASVKIAKQVYECDDISDPFILGILSPRVYLPSGLSKEAREYILKHEFAHLDRRDYLWKPLGFLILSVYWFQPLCWIAYLLLCKDIEYACDEKAIKDIEDAEKAEYCTVLLEYSMPKKMITACPVAFGETDVKNRVKHVANYKKPTFWVIAGSIVVCALIAVCFATSRGTTDLAACPFDDISNEKMYGMAVSYAPNLLVIDKTDAKKMSDALLSSEWVRQDANAQVPDGEYYSLFVYNNGSPFRMNFYVDGFVSFEQNDQLMYYLIDADSENVIYRIVNPKDVSAVADRMREFLPEDITVTGVWEANNDVHEQQMELQEEMLRQKEELQRQQTEAERNRQEMEAQKNNLRQANADAEENLEVSYVEDPVTHEYVVEGDMVFRYKKTLIGKDAAAACPVQYIVLTNDAHITWEKVNKSILSSQSTDWLEDTIIIGMTAVH